MRANRVMDGVNFPSFFLRKKKSLTNSFVCTMSFSNKKKTNVYERKNCFFFFNLRRRRRRRIHVGSQEIGVLQKGDTFSRSIEWIEGG
jgi:hypothetical protein